VGHPHAGVPAARMQFIIRVLAMIKKKKGTKKATAQKSAKKNRKPRLKKEIDVTKVRKEVSQVVKSQATELTQAVVEEGMKGQVGSVRYLFEMANIFPVQENAEAPTEEEDSFAKILLSRMEAPAKPDKDEDDEVDDTELSTEEEAKPAQAVAVRGQESPRLPLGAGPRHTPTSGGNEKKETVETPVGTATSVT
jgi:hypothetical protein